MVPQENVTVQGIKVVQEQKYEKMILYKTLSCINYFSMDGKMYFSLETDLRFIIRNK